MSLFKKMILSTFSEERLVLVLLKDVVQLRILFRMEQRFHIQSVCSLPNSPNVDNERHALSTK